MPAPQLHLTFGSLVKDHDGAPAALRRACAAEPVYVRLGAIFHDLPYYGNMIAEAIRYGLGSPALDEPWAYRMHSVRPARFIASYLRAAATTPGLSRDERLALVGGVLSHCALDLTLHPLVNYCARRDTTLHGGHESVNHRLTEKYHALFFHLHRFGYDPIGTPEMVRATRVVKQSSLLRARAEGPILAFVEDAFGGAYGDAPAAGTWTRWVRSFQHFGVLVGNPLAARNSRLKQKDPSLRERYFENDVFRFWEFYAGSERRLTQLCQLGYDYVDAGDFSRTAEDAFVAAAGIDDLAEPGPSPISDARGELPPLPRLTVRCTPGVTAPPGHLPWRRRERRRALGAAPRSARPDRPPVSAP